MKDSISIGFVGDIMLGELLENIGRGVKTKIESGIDPFEFSKEYFKDIDVMIGNLECTLSNISIRNGVYSNILRAPPSYVKLLKDAGLSAMNMANNHTLDHGGEAFEETIEILKKNDITPFGNPERDCFKSDLEVLNKKGWKIGLLGYNLSNLPSQKLLSIKNKISSNIINYKEDVDILILSLHWGYEYVNFPSWPFTELSEAFISAGANIIYGHHSHQLQGVVKENNKIIGFSLGNFIFDDLRKENRTTAIFEVTYGDKKVKFHEWPFYINNNFQPVPINDCKIYGYINKLNAIANKIYYEKKNKEIIKWHKKAWRKSRIGHLKNRLRIRWRILTNFGVYKPYIKDLIWKKNEIKR